MINIKKELKNVGIKPLEQLSAQEKTSLAEKIATKLASLNVQSINYSNILQRIFNTQIWRAKINSNSKNAIYFSQNQTIYFRENFELENLTEETIQACIQYLQDKRKEQNRSGLSTFEQYKTKGKALNQAGINYISSKILNIQNESKINTLLKQMVLITGEEVFLDSILNTNSRFQNRFIEQTNSKDLYEKLERSFDSILNLEEIINMLTLEGRESRMPQKYLNRINMHKHTINTTFSKIQWEVYSKYFTEKIESIQNAEEAKHYKNQLFDYNQLLEITEDEEKYTNFATEKINQISKVNTNNNIVLVQNTYLNKIIRAIKIIFSKSKEYNTSEE